MVPHRIYQVPLKPDYLADLIRLDFEGSWLQGISWKRKILNILSESALKSIKMLEEVKDFDLLVYDSPMGMCAPLVAELLGIPRVEILMSAPNTPFSFNHMIPMPFSYVPSHLSGFTDRMTFMERSINLVSYLCEKLLLDLLFGSIMNNLKVTLNLNEVTRRLLVVLNWF